MRFGEPVGAGAIHAAVPGDLLELAAAEPQRAFPAIAKDPQACVRLESAVPGDGYLAVQAYLDRAEHAELAEVRGAIAARTGRPVTFGWGPRFLHSTGQYHKGGPARGVFLQITGRLADDLSIPGRPFSYGELIAAQAAGDAAVLAAAGMPVVTFRVRDAAALDAVRTALR